MKQNDKKAYIYLFGMEICEAYKNDPESFKGLTAGDINGMMEEKSVSGHAVRRELDDAEKAVYDMALTDNDEFWDACAIVGESM